MTHELRDLSSFGKLANDRLNLAASMIKTLGTEMTTEVNTFTRYVQNADTNHKITRELNFKQTALNGATTRILNQLEQYSRGLEFLKTGSITVDLIPVKHMTDVIKGIQDSLNRGLPSRQFHVSHTNPSDYYTKRMHFLVTRNDTNLIIGMKIPLSAYQKPFHAYKLNYYPLAIPKNTKDSLMLDHSWKGMAVSTPPQGEDKNISFFELDDADMLELRLTQNLKLEKRVIKTNFAQDCILAIYLDNVKRVKKYCHYHIIVDGMAPALYHLSGAMYYLTHVNDYILRCNKDPDRMYYNKTKCTTTCIVHIPDDCTLTTSNYRIDHAFGITLPKQLYPYEKFLASVPVLLQFFSENDIKTLSGSKLYSADVEITVPPIQVYRNPLADKLPEDNVQRLSLTKAITNLKKDEKIIGSLADSIIVGQSQIAPKPTSMLDISNILSTIFVGLLIVHAIYTLYKIRMLTVALALIQKPGAYAQSGEETDDGKISFNFLPPNTQNEATTTDIHTVLQASIASNWIFIIFAMVIAAIVITAGYCIYRKYCTHFHQRKLHCILALQFSVEQDSVFIKLCSIMASSDDLIVICKNWIEDVNLNGCLSPQLNLAWKAKLWNSFTDQASTIPQSISVKYWDALRLHQILRLAYVVKPVISYQDQILAVSFASTIEDARSNNIFSTYNALHRANSRNDEITTMTDIPHDDELEDKPRRMHIKQTQTSIQISRKAKKPAPEPPTTSQNSQNKIQKGEKSKINTAITMTNGTNSESE